MQKYPENSDQPGIHFILALLFLALIAQGGCNDSNPCWKRMDIGEQTQEALAIWGSSSSDIYAVGYIRNILHYDGDRWSELEADELTDPQWDVWGSSPNNVFAIGHPHIHYDGTSWEIIEGIPAGRYYGVWGSGESDVFFVGNEGLISHFDGEQWSEMNTTTNERLWEVWGSSSTDVYAIGGEETILHYNGFDWQQINSPQHHKPSAAFGGVPRTISTLSTLRG